MSAEFFYEDINSIFFDADMDKDLDLYVVSGGNELRKNASSFQDRLYINDGNGNFQKSNALPPLTTSNSTVRSADYDNDGDMDLFVGGRLVPGKYPVPTSSYILENNGGRFTNVTAQKAPVLNNIGMITDAVFSDYDGDGDQDLLMVGEWMGLTLLKNDGGSWSKHDLQEQTGTGWFYSITKADLDGDNDDDYILGNLGLNNKFGAKKDKPFHVFCDDFDNSGNLDIVLSKKSGDKMVPLRGKECSTQQMPFIGKKFPTFKSFAHADLTQIYGDMSGALHYEANNFNSLVVMNNGGKLEANPLPIEAQFGPTLKTVVKDINKDGHLDIIGGGGIFNAEVETVRFDASKGYVLEGNGKGDFKYVSTPNFIQKGNVKDILDIKIKEKDHLLILKNQGTSQLFMME
jgi:hypothetical protein